MPPATLTAFIDHGVAASTLTVKGGIEEAESVIQQLESMGIDMAAVAVELERQGVQLFIDSFNNLIKVVQEKADCMLSEYKGKANG